MVPMNAMRTLFLAVTITPASAVFEADVFGSRVPAVRACRGYAALAANSDL